MEQETACSFVLLPRAFSSGKSRV